MDYKQSGAYTTAAYVLEPTTKKVKGVAVKSYKGIETAALIFCKAKTYGGTERVVNGVTVLEDTAEIETWFRPDITAGKGFCFASDPSKVYEILGIPENIEQRNLLLKFKVRAVRGGA